MTNKKTQRGWHGVSHQAIKWYPTIAADRCTGCGLCVTSCFRGVLAFDYEADQAAVVTPRMCVVGCTTCACLCPEEVISLPARDYIQRIIKRHKVERQSKEMLQLHPDKYDLKLRWREPVGD